jgi:hypothetical protein
LLPAFGTGLGIPGVPADGGVVGETLGLGKSVGSGAATSGATAADFGFASSFTETSSVTGVAAFFAAAFLTGAFLAGFSSLAGFAAGGNFSKNFRTTGGSTVDDAERTNSPISWSFARTSLLSIPKSFANS